MRLKTIRGPGTCTLPDDPARQSRRAVRIGKSTALSVLHHSSTRELQMLHTSDRCYANLEDTSPRTDGSNDVVGAEDPQRRVWAPLEPTPQSQAQTEQKVVVVRLSPRLKLHATSCDIGGPSVVLQLMHQCVPVFDTFGYPYLALLKQRHGREDEVSLRNRPVPMRAVGTL